MKKIYLLTNSKNLIPQRTYERESLVIEILNKVLISNEFNTEILSFDIFINGRYDIEGNYFFYASSQFTPYKEYIQDILLHIKNNNGIIVPNFCSFIAHDNKMLQELEMKRLDINSPKSHIVGTYEEGYEYLQKVSFPIVGKKSKGFGSKTVEKITNVNEGNYFLKNNLSDGFIFNIEYVKWLYKKWKFNNLYPQYHGKVIFQEMIDGLNHDWKVLIFGNKCFVLKRFTKKNDFRALGSGKFDYDAIPSNEVLDFAYDVLNKLNIPFASLDIVEKNNQCSLIEYQAVHFGLLTALNSKVYYELDSKQWNSKQKNKEVDYFFAEALVDFIGKSK